MAELGKGGAPGLLEVMWRSAWVIVAAAVAAGLLGFVVASRQPKEYMATVRLHISYPDQGSDAPRDPQRRLNDLAARVTSAQVLARAVQKLGSEAPSAEELARSVTAQPSQALDIIDIQARAGSGDRAARIAREMAAAFQEVSSEARLAAAQSAAASLERSRAEIQARVDSATRRLNEVRAAIEGQVNAQIPESAPNLRAQTLEARLATDPGYVGALAERDSALELLRQLSSRSQQLTFDAAARGSEVDLAEPPEVSRQPASPRPARSAALAGLVGFLLSATVVWIFSVSPSAALRRRLVRFPNPPRRSSAAPAPDEGS